MRISITKISRKQLLHYGPRALVVLLILFAALNLFWLLEKNKSVESTPSNLIALGFNESGQLGKASSISEKHLNIPIPTGGASLRQIAAGLRHSVALSETGDVYTWGDNEFGQLGDGKKGGVRASPKKVTGLPKIASIATKQDHTLALDEEGRVWAWGLGISGQLGDGSHENHTKPQLITGLPGRVRLVAAGYRSSMALQDDGSVWVWGGKCDLARQPKQVTDYLASLKVGSYNDVTSNTESGLVTLADDCENEQYIGIHSLLPKKVAGLPSLASISVGYGHMLGLTKDGDLWAWGCNMFGQLGTSTGINDKANHSPTRVKGIGPLKEVSAGFRHTLALGRDGQLWAWGHNYQGELGTGHEYDERFHNRPILISSAERFEHVYAGHDYSVALNAQGNLWSWGGNPTNETVDTGQGTIIAPRAIFNGLHITDAAAGGKHILLRTQQITMEK